MSVFFVCLKTTIDSFSLAQRGGKFIHFWWFSCVVKKLICSRWLMWNNPRRNSRRRPFSGVLYFAHTVTNWLLAVSSDFFTIFPNSLVLYYWSKSPKYFDYRIKRLLYRLVLNFFTDPTKPQWLGIFYAILLSVTVFCQIVLLRAYFQCQFLVGLRFRAAITGLVYRKVSHLHGAHQRIDLSGLFFLL